MVVGEVSRFEIRADYAYGDKGAPSSSTLAPDIKPGQAIVFELELMQIVGSDSSVAAEETNESTRRTLDLERLALLRQERAKALAEREALKAKTAEAAEAKAKAEELAKQTGAAVASSGGGLDKKTVKKMNPKALKVQLKKLGLSIQGNKKTLQARLLATL
jgi:FKBP-type peptidyl-prolyl cis-trans isomerase